MRAVLTRVSSASVTIGGQVQGEIGKGFLILLGVAPTTRPLSAGSWPTRHWGCASLQMKMIK